MSKLKDKVVEINQAEQKEKKKIEDSLLKWRKEEKIPITKNATWKDIIWIQRFEDEEKREKEKDLQTKSKIVQHHKINCKRNIEINILSVIKKTTNRNADIMKEVVW